MATSSGSLQGCCSATLEATEKINGRQLERLLELPAENVDFPGVSVAALGIAFDSWRVSATLERSLIDPPANSTDEGLTW